MSVKHKLIGMASLAVLLLLVVGGFGFTGIAQLNQSASQLQLQSQILGNHLTADMMHDALSSDVLAAVVASSSGDQSALETAQADQREHAQTFREMLAANESLITDPATANALRTVLPVLNSYINSTDRIVSLAESDMSQRLSTPNTPTEPVLLTDETLADGNVAPAAVTPIVETQPSQALNELDDFRDAYAQLADQMGSLTELIERNASAVQAEAGETAVASNLMMGAALGVGVLLMVTLAWLISRSIVGPLNELLANAEIAATGNLGTSLTINGSQEIANSARALETMRLNLSTMVAAIGDSAKQLSSASDDMTSATSKSRGSVDHQQAAISQVAAAMHEMTATSQEVADNIKRIADAAVAANQESTSGTEVVRGTISDVRDLAAQIEQSAAVINQLNEDSEDISGVLSTITGIAEQTNLLALNAAIEAARAGEQGRGFAVVADEVRTLASRTQQSIGQIQATIEKLQGGSQSAVKAMESSRNKSGKVMEQARRAGASLEAIVRGVSEIKDMSVQIADAAAQQSTVSEDISRSLEQIDGQSHITTEGLGRTSQSAVAVADIASELTKAVSKFRL